MAAIRANHDLRPFGDRDATLCASLDADDASVFDQELVHREALAHLRASLSRGVDEQFVEHRASDAIRDRRVASCPGDPDSVKGPKSNAYV